MDENTQSITTPKEDFDNFLLFSSWKQQTVSGQNIYLKNKWGLTLTEECEGNLFVYNWANERMFISRFRGLDEFKKIKEDYMI